MPSGTRGRRSRQEWIDDEKRTARDGEGTPVPQGERYSTIGEVAAVLGRDEKTIKRRLARGAMPTADAITKHGWQLWSPSTLKRMIDREAQKVRSM